MNALTHARMSRQIAVNELTQERQLDLADSLETSSEFFHGQLVKAGHVEFFNQKTENSDSLHLSDIVGDLVVAELEPIVIEFWQAMTCGDVLTQKAATKVLFNALDKKIGDAISLAVRDEHGIP